MCASLSGEGPPTPVTCQRPPVPGRGDGGRATTRPERSVLSPRPASSPRLGVGGGRPGAGGLTGSRRSGRSRPVAAALSAKRARDPGPGDPPAAKGARKAMLLRPALPSAGGYLWAGVSRTWEGGSGSTRRAAQATLPCPPAPAILLKACAGQGPVHAATGACWSTSTSPPSLRPSPPPLGPQAVAYPRSLAVQCSAGCLSHSPQWGLLRILLRGTGL